LIEIRDDCFRLRAGQRRREASAARLTPKVARFWGRRRKEKDEASALPWSGSRRANDECTKLFTAGQSASSKLRVLAHDRWL